jgi:hypothetical protein
MKSEAKHKRNLKSMKAQHGRKILAGKVLVFTRSASCCRAKSRGQAKAGTLLAPTEPLALSHPLGLRQYKQNQRQNGSAPKPKHLQLLKGGRTRVLLVGKMSS